MNIRFTQKPGQAIQDSGPGFKLKRRRKKHAEKKYKKTVDKPNTSWYPLKVRSEKKAEFTLTSAFMETTQVNIARYCGRMSHRCAGVII